MKINLQYDKSEIDFHHFCHIQQAEPTVNVDEVSESPKTRMSLPSWRDLDDPCECKEQRHHNPIFLQQSPRVTRMIAWTLLGSSLMVGPRTKCCVHGPKQSPIY